MLPENSFNQTWTDQAVEAKRRNIDTHPKYGSTEPELTETMMNWRRNYQFCPTGIDETNNTKTLSWVPHTHPALSQHRKNQQTKRSLLQVLNQLESKTNPKPSAMTYLTCGSDNHLWDQIKRFRAKPMPNPSPGNEGLNLDIQNLMNPQSAFQFTNEDCKYGIVIAANAFTPGGGMSVSSAQEEACMQSSNAWMQMPRGYYGTQPAARFNDRTSPLQEIGGGFRLDNVTIFNPKTPQETRTASFIFVANPDLRAGSGGREKWEALSTNQGQFDHFMEANYQNIRLILSHALEANLTHLDLNPIGCGVFNNPPYYVAAAYRLIIEEFKSQPETAAQMSNLTLRFAIGGRGPKNERLISIFEQIINKTPLRQVQEIVTFASDEHKKALYQSMVHHGIAKNAATYQRFGLIPALTKDNHQEVLIAYQRVDLIPALTQDNHQEVLIAYQRIGLIPALTQDNHPAVLIAYQRFGLIPALTQDNHPAVLAALEKFYPPPTPWISITVATSLIVTATLALFKPALLPIIGKFILSITALPLSAPAIGTASIILSSLLLGLVAIAPSIIGLTHFIHRKPFKEALKNIENPSNDPAQLSGSAHSDRR